MKSTVIVVKGYITRLASFIAFQPTQTLETDHICFIQSSHHF